MARKLYKVSFTGFILVYADNAKEAAEIAEDGSEITVIGCAERMSVKLDAVYFSVFTDCIEQSS